MNKAIKLQKRDRILTLDILRGFFILVMAIDHLGYFPSLFEFFTGRGLLWSSAAEGFFIISGILVGYIYGPRMLQSVSQTFKKLWMRGLKLYLWSVALTILFVVWGNIIGPEMAKAPLWVDPPFGEFILKVFSLNYVYGWADFLRYYAVYMMFAPFGLLLLRQKKALLFAGVIFAVWLLRGRNFFLAWQLLFMVGIIVGYYLPVIEECFKALAVRSRSIYLRTLVGLSAVTLIISIFATRIVPSALDGQYLGSSFTVSPSMHSFATWLLKLSDRPGAFLDKWTLGPGRVFIALMWFATLYILVRANEQSIDNKTKGVLRFLGQNGLFIYGAHAVIVFAVLSYRPKPFGFVVNTLLTAVFIALIYGITLFKVRIEKSRKLTT